MNIRVSADKEKHLEIYPDPATVTVGEHVSWDLYYDGRYAPNSDPLAWTIYFSSGSPFKKWTELRVETDAKQGPEQKARIEGGSPDSAGDYKYGVRIENTRTKQLLCDDDPWLIVRPRSA